MLGHGWKKQESCIRDMGRCPKAARMCVRTAGISLLPDSVMIVRASCSLEIHKRRAWHIKAIRMGAWGKRTLTNVGAQNGHFTH